MYRLSKDIIETVTYYDVLEFPLSVFEIWKHLVTLTENARPSSYFEILTIVKGECARGVIEECCGFYFLPGRELLVRKRIQREKISVAKLKRVKRLARLIQYVPYVRFIGSTGSLSLKHGDIESDWDLFVVLRAGKIWTGRVVLTGFLFLLGKWRHGRHVRNRACLNYYVADTNLEIGTQDLFSAHEYRFMIPLFHYALFQRFELRNRWIVRFKPNFSLSEIPTLWSVPYQKDTVRSFFEKWFDRWNIESALAVWQKGKISRNPKTHWKGSYIEASDRALVFLPRPRGPRVYEAFKNRLSSF
ncbi:MAG: hypothetical protein KBC19_02380 [Candidatus Moranbacteria bacterium]|nr:hypothetical protein [Candidatus Moranbacteria bacterium]